MNQKRISILECKNQDITLRSNQVEFLEFVEQNWDQCDVIVGEIDVGGGKSICATTIANWVNTNQIGDNALIVPTKILQNQYTGEFDWIPSLKGMDNYKCEQYGMSCRDYKRGNEKCCGGAGVCAYISARVDAVNAGTAIFNFHSYMSIREKKKFLIIDEGHNTENFLLSLYEKTIWLCEHGKGDIDPYSQEDVVNFISEIQQRLETDLAIGISKKADDKYLSKLEDEIDKYSRMTDLIRNHWSDTATALKEEKYFSREKDFKRFNDMKQKCLIIKPLKLHNLAEKVLWNSAQKVVFLSATFSELDIDLLGLKGKRVGYFKAKPVIPPDRRPFRIWPIASMAFRNRGESIPKITEAIKTIAKNHSNEKGIIHCTYEMNKYLLEKLGHDQRFIFHDNKNKINQYEYFLACKEPVILVASGMSEGINLAEDLARWQIITQVMYPNTQDPVNNWRLKNNINLYYWGAVKTIEQQSGRVCRSAKDFGVTYILDNEFVSLWTKTRIIPNMWAQWFKDMMVWPKKKD